MAFDQKQHWHVDFKESYDKEKLLEGIEKIRLVYERGNICYVQKPTVSLSFRSTRRNIELLRDVRPKMRW